MEQPEFLHACPVCSSSEFEQFISCKDFTVSHETFSIVKCMSCGLKFTNPRPSESGIEKYYQSEDYISHSNTSQGLINTLYKVARKFTIWQKSKLIRSISPEGMRLLDYGCGTGEFLIAMKSSGWQAVGAEPNARARISARENYKIEVVEPDKIHSLVPKFDVITLWHVLEHVHQLKSTVEELKRLLIPGGKILFAVPNSDSADAIHYKEYWAAYDVPRHLYHFNASSMSRLFTNHQLRLLNIMRMPLDAFYVSMLSEKYKNSRALLKGTVQGGWSAVNAITDRQKSSSLIFVCSQ